MMTPRGYDSRRQRRRGSHVLRHAVVLTLAVLLLVGAGFSAWWFALRDTTTETTAFPPCPTPTVTVTSKPVALPPGKVKVNVYNAGSVAGLAGRVSKDFKARGFQVAAVANDPQKANVTAPVQLRFGTAGYSAAATVLAEVPNAQVVVDNRSTAIVDVVLGDSFKQLAPAAAAAKTLKTATVAPSPNAVRTAASPSSTAGASVGTPTATATPTPSGTGSNRCIPQPTATVTADPFRTGAATASPSGTARSSASSKPSAKATASKKG